MSHYDYHHSKKPYQNFDERWKGGSIQLSNQRQNVELPEVNTETFVNSAKEINRLLHEAVILSNELINTDLGKEIMEAGQKSDTDKIQRLIKEIGITQHVDISYTPHSITFTSTPIESKNHGLKTTLTMQLIWNEAF